MRLIVLGAPGAGKGTQALMLSEKYNILHISTGDIFRSNIKQGTELGKKAKEFIDAGMLVPDELTLSLIMDRLHQPDCEAGYILDGFPRTIPQAESLTEALKTDGVELNAVLDIEVPDEVIVARMSGRRVCPVCGDSYHVENRPPKVEGICDRCGANLIIRKDDAPETVLNRLNVYHEQTQPLIDYYRAQGKLLTFDGTAPMQDVFGSITEALDKADGSCN